MPALRTSTALRALLAIGAIAGLAAVVHLATGGPPLAAARVQPQQELAPSRVAPTVAPQAPFIGVVVGSEEVALAPRLGGRLESIEVQVGDAVAKGALIARLDARESEQALKQARAGLNVAQAERERARIAAEQLRDRLGRTRAITEWVATEEIKRDEFALASAEAELASATARFAEKAALVEQLRVTNDDRELRAPFDAQVAEVLAVAGGQVAAAQPLVRLIGTGPQKIRFAVPSHLRARLASGTAVEVSLNGLSERLRARVEWVAPEVDPITGQVFAEAKWTDARQEALATPGAPAEVRIAGEPQP